METRDGVAKPNAKKVTAYGPGLEPGQVFPGKPTAFTVDSSETAPAPVAVDIKTLDGKDLAKRPSISLKDDGNHEVSYVPPLVDEPYEVKIRQFSGMI